MPENKLPLTFYLRDDVTQIARELLGKRLVTLKDGVLTAGIIVETEAYGGITDRASHAFNGLHSARTRVLYSQGGIAYVYFIYGMHYMLNVVTGKEGVPDAVLIRAIEPQTGVEAMLERRNMKKLQPALTNGPAKLTRALGIDLEWNGYPFTGNKLWIEDFKREVRESEIVSGPRIGVDYAGVDARRPWRFWIKENPFVSKTRS